MDLLINHLPSEINLYVAAPADEPYYSRWRKNDRIVDIIKLPHRSFSPLALLRLAGYAAERKIDVVHSHGKGAGLYARLLKLFLPRLHVVHSLHGLHVGSYGFLKRKLYVCYERAMSFLTDRFVNCSFGEQTSCLDLKLFSRKKAAVVYNGVVPFSMCPSAKESLGLEGMFLVLTISRFDYQKNMDSAFDIAAKMLGYDDIRFLWVGDGDDRQRLESKGAEKKMRNIIFAGFTDEIRKYLSAADVYLSTSRWEGLPIALIEACSVGLPVVASDVVGNSEVVTNGLNGLLFPLTEPDVAVEGILKLYRNRGTREAMSTSAKKIFDMNFRVEPMVARIVRVYQEVTGIR